MTVRDMLASMQEMTGTTVETDLPLDDEVEFQDMCLEVSWQIDRTSGTKTRLHRLCRKTDGMRRTERETA